MVTAKKTNCLREPVFTTISRVRVQTNHFAAFFLDVKKISYYVRTSCVWASKSLVVAQLPAQASRSPLKQHRATCSYPFAQLALKKIERTKEIRLASFEPGMQLLEAKYLVLFIGSSPLQMFPVGHSLVCVNKSHQFIHKKKRNQN